MVELEAQIMKTAHLTLLSMFHGYHQSLNHSIKVEGLKEKKSANKKKYPMNRELNDR